MALNGGVPTILHPELILKAEGHLVSACPVMADLVAAHGRCRIDERNQGVFETLADSIIGQQLSAKAAQTIRRRLRMMVPTFSPEIISTLNDDQLRSVGLSRSKAHYIRELAKRNSEGQLTLATFTDMDDDKVISYLTMFPGIGRWTAEMFLIFGLARLDVLATSDVGLQRSARLLFGGSRGLASIAEVWRPYRSVASWYLWRNLDAPVGGF